MNPVEINPSALERLIYAIDMLLITATKEGDINKVKKLLDEDNLKIDFQDKSGATALFYASQEGYADIAQLLIDKEANVYIANINGTAPLHVASQNGHFGVVEKLIKKDAGVVDLPQKDGATALFFASQSDHYGVVEQLIKAKANLDLPTKSGLTPIFRACQTNNLECVKALFNAGANVKCLTEGGNFFGTQINRKLKGVSEEMTTLIETITKKENIEKRDEALKNRPSPDASRAEARAAQATRGRY
jgi:ankyrin repeat protein